MSDLEVVRITGDWEIPIDATCPEHGRRRWPSEVIWYVHTAGHPRACDRGWWWIFFCPKCDRVIAGENAPTSLRIRRVNGHPFLEGAGCLPTCRIPAIS